MDGKDGDKRATRVCVYLERICTSSNEGQAGKTQRKNSRQTPISYKPRQLSEERGAILTEKNIKPWPMRLARVRVT